MIACAWMNCWVVGVPPRWSITAVTVIGRISGIRRRAASRDISRSREVFEPGRFEGECSVVPHHGQFGRVHPPGEVGKIGIITI